jgi:GH25 family lysozyme M1 (1,4-beta-N-acetylmuramidase)
LSRAVGIDVNDWHPVKQWDAVVAAGVDFVGVKATEGTVFTGKILASSREEIRRRPFKLAVYYHYSRSGSASAQARHLMDAVGPLAPNERLCLDLEGRTPTPEDPHRALAWCDEFFDTLMGGACSDRRPLLYTSNRIWQTMGDPEWALASEIDLWVPRYSRQEPVVPRPWAAWGWTFWQHTDGADPEPYSVPGVGLCDGNYFRGTSSELDFYARLRR